MTNDEVLQKLSILANRLDTDRIVTQYTSNEGAVAANSALHWLTFFQVDPNDKAAQRALDDCKKELRQALNKHERYLSRPGNTMGDPSAAPIAAQHAMERFILRIQGKML